MITMKTVMVVAGALALTAGRGIDPVSGAGLGLTPPKSSASASHATVRVTTITGGGAVIQVLPGPDFYADSAMAIINKAPAEQQKMLKMMAMNGPFSDKVARISGEFKGTFWDRGQGVNSGDSVAAVATFKTEDGASWRVVIDRVDPVDASPMDPHWGGVGTDVTYHGATGLGVPLVPTVSSAVSYYGFASVYRDGKLVNGKAPIHVMLTSQARGKARGSDFAYTCWNCTKNRIEELHLMLMPPMGTMYPVPGGTLHVMWQHSRYHTQG